MDETQLAALFELLGAPDPNDWARSQAREGLPQLARFLFLRQAWLNVLRPSDTAWIDEALKKKPSEPGGGIVRSLRNAEAAGVARQDLTEIVRVKQWELLFKFCCLLDDPQIEEADAEHISWGLFQIGGDDAPGQRISGLHESVLETDPTGREMRPT